MPPSVSAEPQNATPLPDPRCPRCAYDLSGETDTWQTQCPTEGRCPECGLTFEWTNIYTDNLSPGYVENAQRFKLRDAFRTWRRALRPRRFWKWLAIENEIRPRRLTQALAFNLIAPPIAILLLTVAIATVGYTYTQFAHANASVNAPPPQALRYRAPVLSSPPPAGTWLDAALTGPNFQDPLYYLFSRPSRLSRSLGVPHLGLLRRAETNSAIISASAVVLPFLIVPALYLLLDKTFAKARIRRAHILRMATHSTAPLFLPMLIAWPAAMIETTLIDLDRATYLRFRPGRTILDALEHAGDVRSAAVLAIPVIALLWLPLFYWQANRHYLRIRHAFAVAVSFTAIAALVTSIAALYSYFFIFDR